MKLKILTYLLFLCCVTAHAAVKGMNGESLLSYCEASLSLLEKQAKTVNVESASKSGVCLGYITAFEDITNLNASKPVELPTEVSPDSAASAPKPLPYCMPDEVSLTQEVRVVVKYLQDHPQQLQQPASELLSTLFAQAFPCSGMKSG